MPEIKGLTGLRPDEKYVKRITCPPYDVIKQGSPLEGVLSQEAYSLYHITLGKDPLTALHMFITDGVLQNDDVPCFYVYEQNYAGVTRTGVLAAVQVTEYKEGQIIRHEKTFDEKVKGRLELRQKTGVTFEPVFLLTRTDINPVLEKAKAQERKVYEFVSDFAGQSELDGIFNRIYRVPERSPEGKRLKELLQQTPFYIADGHHRYHASLLNRQSHCLAYICQADQASIQAYNRVINGRRKFKEIKDQIPNLEKVREFATPPKHYFAIYSQGESYLLQATDVPADVIGRLDCSILEKELYPFLGLSPELIRDTRYFDYYPESDLGLMKKIVDSGSYDLAVALHPVSIRELLAVADAGIANSEIVMPEKSTFFSPKILSGLFLYRHKVM